MRTNTVRLRLEVTLQLAHSNRMQPPSTDRWNCISYATCSYGSHCIASVRAVDESPLADDIIKCLLRLLYSASLLSYCQQKCGSAIPVSAAPPARPADGGLDTAGCTRCIHPNRAVRRP